MKKIDATATTISRRAFLAALGLGGAAFIAGCSQQGDSSEAEAAEETTEAVEDAAAAEGADNESASAEDSAAETGKTLVAYYSAQGHTAAVAEVLAAELGADIFEIVPAEPYSSDDLNYNDESSRVCQEYEDESLRETPLAQTTPDGWDAYDRVLVGYPIWWGIAAWPTNRFASDNDFTGKTVVPFCTSASSSLGESGTLLAELAGTGDWVEGMRFQSNVDDVDVIAWAQSL